MKITTSKNFLSALLATAGAVFSFAVGDTALEMVDLRGHASNFEMFENMGCRSSEGQVGSQRNGDFDIYRKISHESCKTKCLDLGEECFGYEYFSRRRRCKVWNVEIGGDKLDYKDGMDCYIKDYRGALELHDTPTTFPTLLPEETIVLKPASITHSDGFEMFDDRGCRATGGGGGSEQTGEFVVYRNIYRITCEAICLSLGQNCFGYEYVPRLEWCKIWQVSVEESDEHEIGSDCYIKTGNEGIAGHTPTIRPTHRPTPNPTHRCLYQSDFAFGTKIITDPGVYKLCQDIVFAPGKPDYITSSDEDIANAFDPFTVGGTQYHSNEFSLGYFAALVIAADDVTLLLNGHTIRQDPSHALMQRFYAHIELASSPFIKNTGPAQFVSGSGFVPARNFILEGAGTLGLSSHHGIHGNDNEHVQISGVTFRDFEVAAVSLNNVKGLSVKDCNIPNNRLDVPVVGSFSATRFILPYIKALRYANDKPYSMLLRGSETSSVAVYDALVKSIANVYQDVMRSGFIDSAAHPEEYNLYHNPHQSVDGNCYAILVHGRGPAVAGQGFALSTNNTETSSHVDISDNNVGTMKCWTNSVPGVVINDKVQKDARGGVLQLINTLTNQWLASDASHRYIGNVITDAQIMVASAIHDGVLDPNDNILQTKPNTIDPAIVSWAAHPSLSLVPSFRCNGDSMFHVNKGMIMIRVEDTRGFKIDRNTIGPVTVESGPAAGSQEYFDQFPGTHRWTCTDYHEGSVEDGSEQQLANLRGISVAAVSSFPDGTRSTIEANTIHSFESENANSIVGIDIQGVSSGITVSKNLVNLKDGVGKNAYDQFIAYRVRKFVSQNDIITLDDNLFAQESNYEVDDNDRQLRSRKMPERHPAVHTEWEYGGCPFSYA